MTLITFVALYLLVSVTIGLVAAMRVKNTADYALAGRSLPLIMIVTTTFATWFGSETVLGIPSKFIEGGLRATVEDPFGASFALILVGMFFAHKLYRQNLLTIGDYYRKRYGRGVEIFTSAVILISYLGWVAAQITALGLVFTLLSGGAISVVMGMAIGTGVVLVYTVFGGMWSVALTDFLQMIIIVIGLSLIAWFASDLAGGSGRVIELAGTRDMFRLLPEPNFHAWLFWIGAAITIMIGSIPQQDVFQRVMSAKDAKTAVRGPIIGGVAYLLFAFVPMYIALSAFIVMPEAAAALQADDPQKILPSLVMEHMPVWLQVMFFGALLSAIMSTASATLLAPSTTFVENIVKNFRPLTDRQQLAAMRFTVVLFAGCVLVYSIIMEGTPIFELVAMAYQFPVVGAFWPLETAMAYQFPVVGAFWPLVCGLYWSRSTTQGATWSIVLGMSTWALLAGTPAGEIFPSVLGGFLMAGIGMIAGSLAPTRGNREHAPAASR